LKLAKLAALEQLVPVIFQRSKYVASLAGEYRKTLKGRINRVQNTFGRCSPHGLNYLLGNVRGVRKDWKESLNTGGN